MTWETITLNSYNYTKSTDLEKISFKLDTDEGAKIICFTLTPLKGFNEPASIFKGDCLADELAKSNKEAYGFLEMAARLLLKMPVDLSLSQ